MCRRNLAVEAEINSEVHDFETLRANLGVVHQRCRLDHDRKYHFDPTGRRTAILPERKRRHHLERKHADALISMSDHIQW